jgi:hypothetical protein
VEVNDNVKHSSLLRYGNIYNLKKVGILKSAYD